MRKHHLFAPLLALALLLSLAACGRSAPTAPSPAPAARRALTREEIQRANEAFASIDAQDRNGTIRATPASCFFTSDYDAVADLDFAAFLCYFPDDGCLGAEDQAEFDALAALPGFDWPGAGGPDDLPVPVHRILRASVDAALERYAGIAAADLTDTSGVLYLEDYDAWYTFTSDFGPGAFRCAGGETAGDTARLWSAAGEDGSRAELTLQRAGDAWRIRSFGHSDPDPDATLAGLLLRLTGEDIGFVSWTGLSEAPTAEELAVLIREAAQHSIDHGALTLNGSDTDVVWSLDLYLAPRDQGAYSGDDGLHFFIGLEENVVEIFGGANLPEGRVWVEDEALYRLIRTQNDRPPDIDQAAYAPCRDLTDAYFDARLTEAWDGGFSGWELTAFRKAWESEALNAAAYGIAAAYCTDPPEEAVHMLAGGMYVDSALRAHGLDWQLTYLVTVDGAPAGILKQNPEEAPENPLDAFADRDALLAALWTPEGAARPVWGEQVFQRDYAGEDSQAGTPDGVSVRLRFAMPAIRNAAGTPAWERLNDTFAAQGQEWLSKGREYWGTPGLEPGGDYEVESTYTVQRCDALLSLRYQRSERLSGPPAVTVSGALFDFNTGDALYSMESLFRVSAEEFRPVLLSELAGWEGDPYGPAYYEGYFSFTDFYLTQTDLVLLFPVWEGEATSPTSTLERPVPLARLEGLLAGNL